MENHSHAWRGVWDRPMKMDENKMHPFTVARMTDHNVKGCDLPVNPPDIHVGFVRATGDHDQPEGAENEKSSGLL